MIRSVPEIIITYRIRLALHIAIVSSESWEANKDGIFKLLRRPGIYAKESIPLGYVAWGGIFKLFGDQESISSSRFRQPM